MSFQDRVVEARASGDFNRLVEAVPYFRWLGLQIELQDGQPICKLPFRDMMIGNPMLPALHGGVTGAFIESAAIVSLMAALDTPRLPKTINITIEYLRPGRPVDSFATGLITKQGRRVANVRAEAWQDSRDQPIAYANAHFLLA